MRATTPVFCLFLLLGTVATTVPGSSTNYPKDYFRSPLGIPLVLAGNFAEMRDNHFHGGLDIKTNDGEGYRVYAAADGYISRVKVSPYGYGNALYVAHPNGYTTVYAHVDRFKGRIAGYVRRLQESRKSFAIDKYLEADRYPVKKGDVIALSGNSGSSSGPHLHFEIRKTAGQIPVNPMLFGLEIPDGRAPRIFSIRIYPRDNESGVRVTSGALVETARGRNEHVTLDVNDSRGALRPNADAIEAWGRIGFGIQTHDYHDGSGNRLGVYTITLSEDGKPIFKSTMDEVSFGNTRYINAHVDYAERNQNRRWIQRSYRLPGNELPIYQTVDDGIVTFTAGKRANLVYDVVDAHGNASALTFSVRGVSAPVEHAARGTNGHSSASTNGTNASTDDAASEEVHVSIRHSEPAILRREGIEAVFPANAFYDDFDLSYSVRAAPTGTFSQLHVVHDQSVPVHKRYNLSIAPSGLPADLRSKALIASVDDKERLSSAGGAYEAGHVRTRIRSLGQFIVTVDTLAPTIKSLDLQDGGRLGARASVRFIIDDDLAGIIKYNGYLDGKWVLFAYDAKRKQLYHELDPNLKSGLHKLVVEVEDAKANVGRLELAFRK